MSAIFISHSSKDHDFAIQLHAQLKTRGHESVFLDAERNDGILGGEQWERVLYRELRRCQVLVALISKDWLESRWCFAEATHAREKGKAIIGLSLCSGLEQSLLGDTQLIDLSPEQRETGYQRLWAALKNAIDPRGMVAWDKNRAPYPGLSAFEEQDAAVYFGRDDAVSKSGRASPP